MTEFQAVYYDGRTSARTQVRVRGSPTGLQIRADGLSVEVPLAQVKVDPPLSGAARALHLPGGAQLQTDDHAAVDALFPRANPLAHWIHALEQRWKYALTGVAVAAVFAWACIAYGLPAVARLAAEHFPREFETRLGEQTLSGIDNGMCRQSTLDSSRQQALRRNFTVLTAGLDDGYTYRLEMRSCARVGPNAFALPGGAIVLTDELVKLAQNDAQISAVLTHEIGHVRNRHGIRIAMQAAGLAVLIAVLAGDATSITSLAATLPTALLLNGYSREFETEADTYAFRRLKEIGISPKSFAEIMTLMEEYQPGGPAAKGDEGQTVRKDEKNTYLSTHPATAERIKRALDYQ